MQGERDACNAGSGGAAAAAGGEEWRSGSITAQGGTEGGE